MPDPTITTTDLEEVLKTLSERVKELSGHFSNVVTKIETIFPATSKFSTTLESLSKSFGVSSKGLGDSLKKLVESFEELEEHAEKLNNTLEKARDLFGEEFRKKIAELEIDFRSTIEVYSEDFREFTDTLEKNAGTVNSLGKEIYNFIYKVTEGKISVFEASKQLSDFTTKIVDLWESATVRKTLKLTKDATDTLVLLYNRFNMISEMTKRNIRNALEPYINKIKEHIGTLKEAVPVGSEFANQLSEIEKHFEKIKDTATPDELKKINDELIKMTESLTKMIGHLKDYSKSAKEIILAQKTLNELYDNFKKTASTIPGPLGTMLTQLAGLLKKFGDIVLAIKGVSASLEFLKTFATYVKQLTAIVGAGSVALGSVVVIVVALAEALRQLAVSGAQLIKTTTSAFGQLIFGTTSINAFTKGLINAWTILYSTTDIIKKSGEVLTVLRPIISTSIHNLYEGVDGFATRAAQFSLVIDRVARGLGTTAKELSGDLLEFATFFGFSVDKYINMGREGARELLRLYAGFSRKVTELVNMTGKEITSVFKSTFEYLMWLTKDAKAKSFALLEDLLKVVGTTVKNFGGTIEHTKTLLSSLSQAVQSSTWDMYLGVLAATGRWTGTLDDMIHKAFTTEPIQRMYETVNYFRSIAKESAGLQKTWVYFVPQLRSAVERVPAMAQHLGTILDRWIREVSVGHVDSRKAFEQALEGAGLSADQIEDAMLAVDALGDPLKMIVNLLQRLVDIASNMLGIWKVAGAAVRIVR